MRRTKRTTRPDGEEAQDAETEDDAGADLPTIPDTLQRSITARLPGVPYVPPVRRINMNDMTGRHQWNATRCTDMDYDGFVTHGTNGRKDMQTFREIREREGLASALAEWTYFSNSHTWYQILRTIRTDRTFARDEADAIYVDHMDTFLNRAIRTYRQIEMRNLPLVATGHTLMGRWYNWFSLNRSLVVEATWRAVHGRLVPADADSIEAEPVNQRNYEWNYPATPTWFSEHWFPSGVLTPTPPVIFYYHWEIMNTTNRDHLRMWHRLIELEWAEIFLTMWWHEAARGQRAYVVPHETIDWLRRRLQNIPIDPDTPYGEQNTTTADYVLDATGRSRTVLGQDSIQ